MDSRLAGSGSEWLYRQYVAYVKRARRGFVRELSTRAARGHFLRHSRIVSREEFAAQAAQRGPEWLQRLSLLVAQEGHQDQDRRRARAAGLLRRAGI